VPVSLAVSFYRISLRLVFPACGIDRGASTHAPESGRRFFWARRFQSPFGLPTAPSPKKSLINLLKSRDLNAKPAQITVGLRLTLKLRPRPFKPNIDAMTKYRLPPCRLQHVAI